MSTDEETVVDRLRRVHSQYKQRDLQRQLEDTADTLAELYLQKVVYETVLDTTISIDEDLRSTIQEIRSHLEDGDTETVTEQVGTLKERVQAFENELEKEISEPLSTYRSNVNSMQRLNQRLDVFDTAELEGLRRFLEPGDVLSRIDFEEEADLEEKIATAGAVAAEYRTTYDSARTELFETYLETEYGDKVTMMMSDSPPMLESFDEQELDDLYESDLAPYIELRFG
jgi:hypothetical protein